MKKVSILLVAVLLFSFSEKENSFSINDPAASDDSYKEFLLDYFEKTYDDLSKSVNGLSPEQLQFKSSDDRWSISQCLEHIILTEKMFFEQTEASMKLPPNPERRAEMKFADKDLIKIMTDRSQKIKAPSALIGKGVYDDPQKAMEDFKTQREKILAFIRETPVEELRNHIGDLPFGPADTYQSLLFMAGHSARHTKQIEEVKESENFPQK